MNFPLEAAVGEMPDEAKMALSAAIEQMQVRDSLKMYNNLVERCFRECIEDMRSKTMSSKEQECTARCVEKFMNVTGRVGLRFSEFYQQMEAAAVAQMSERSAQK